MKRRFRCLLGITAVVASATLFADSAEVHVIERVSLDGVVGEQLSDTMLYTGQSYFTQTAPKMGGYIFVGWMTSATEGFAQRDVFGRSFDSAPYFLYDAITLTANYISEDVDTDADGMPDGHELYWYGNLTKTPESDGDGDGVTFAQEIQHGTNPLFPDRSLVGVFGDVSAKTLYNPSGYARYLFRSEPEGVLFATIIGYAKPGDEISTPTMSRVDDAFAYWKQRVGSAAYTQVRDAFGRAVDGVTFTMGTEDVECVAVLVMDDLDRYWSYWYGSSSAVALSDTDGDGMTFAEETTAGMNPLFYDKSLVGVFSGASAMVAYNPNHYHSYVIRSDPEGALFETISGKAVAGTALETPELSRMADEFAGWTLNGVRVADVFGRALDKVSFTMGDEDVEYVAQVIVDETERNWTYWFGDAPYNPESDTDGDGMTFAEEMAAGMNPLFPDRAFVGVVSDPSGETEMNLQPYEQVQGAIVGNQFKHFFTSPIAGNEAQSETFGEDLQPIVWDLNGDGLFDLVLVYKGGYKTFINVGDSGNPEFEERKDVAIDGVDLDVNGIEKVYSLALDVEPIGGLSATTNGIALLVSDTYGRIWYYENCVLQHKVWGGSHAGFAEGLRLAAVDWDEDGDLDCLAGTANGKLMLLRDPKVGRPTNFKAEAGIDTVVLTWDPNQQSRIRGYRLYRASGESEDFGRIAEPQLPTYRDTPPETATYGYKVSSVSRFYTAGNSTPTVTESPATEVVRATLGSVTFGWHDVNAKFGERVEVVISIENALNYNVAGKSQSLAYDPEYLRPVEVVKSGITENIEMTDSAQNGSWTVTMTSGVLPAGSGRFLTFVFEALKEGTTTVGGATVEIASAATARYFLGDVNGDGELTKADAQLLARLKNGNEKWNADELKAGDFNGNGKLDNADYQALRALLRDLGVL